MKLLITVLTAADIVIALMLIALVLVQQSKDGGFGSSFGGVGDAVFGAHAQSHLAKLTVAFGSLFLLITLALTIITGRSHGPVSAAENPALLPTAAETVTPATPTTPPPNEYQVTTEPPMPTPPSTAVPEVPSAETPAPPMPPEPVATP